GAEARVPRRTARPLASGRVRAPSRQSAQPRRQATPLPRRWLGERERRPALTAESSPRGLPRCGGIGRPADIRPQRVPDPPPQARAVSHALLRVTSGKRGIAQQAPRRTRNASAVSRAPERYADAIATFGSG